MPLILSNPPGIPDGGPAAPIIRKIKARSPEGEEAQVPVMYPGMSIRDHIFAAAIQGASLTICSDYFKLLKSLKADAADPETGEDDPEKDMATATKHLRVYCQAGVDVADVITDFAMAKREVELKRMMAHFATQKGGNNKNRIIRPGEGEP